MDVKLYLSILGYEEEITNTKQLLNSSLIKKILLLNVNGYHLDIIRPPYNDVPKFLPKTVNRLIPAFKEVDYDVHIISKNPLGVLDKLQLWGTPEVTIQFEAFKDAHQVTRTLEMIRKRGFPPGICVDLPTPINTVDKEILDASDLILVMSVKVGRGGQRFNNAALKKTEKIRKKFPDKIIEVDGGLNEYNGHLCMEMGADRLVVGSKITSSTRPEEAVQKLREAWTHTRGDLKTIT